MIGFEGAVALHQAEALIVLVNEGSRARAGRVGERTPQPLAGAGLNQQPVRIVQLGAKAILYAMVVFAGQVHRCERSETEFHVLPPREQRRPHVEDALVPRRQLQMEGAGRGLPIEQRIDCRARGARRGRLDPEFAKKRKAFLVRARFDAEAARRQAVLLFASEKPKIARAQEGDRLVVYIGIVERKMQPEAGEAEIDRRIFRRLDPAIVEQRRRIGNWRGQPVANHIDRDRAPIEEAEMKGLQPEGAAGFAEKSAILPKADVAPIVIVEFVESLGQPRRRILERRGGEFASAVDNLLETKPRRLGARDARTLRGLRENDARRACRGDGAEHLAASKYAHVAFLRDLSSRFVRRGEETGVSSGAAQKSRGAEGSVA